MFAKFKLNVLYNCHIFVNIDMVYKQKHYNCLTGFPMSQYFIFKNKIKTGKRIKKPVKRKILHLPVLLLL